MGVNTLRKFIVLDETKDNVGVALVDLEKDEFINLDGKRIEIKERIPFRFKFSLGFILEGEEVIKDGFPIGFAKRDISPGSLVHVQNIASKRSKEWIK